MNCVKPLPNEPSKAFVVFRRFLASGLKRSFASLAAETSLAESTLRRWSRLYRWTDRAEQYDLDLIAEEERLQHEELKSRAADWARRREEMRELDWQTAGEANKRAREILDNPRVRCTMRDATALLEIVILLHTRLFPSTDNTVMTENQLFLQKIRPFLHKAYEAAPAAELGKTQSANIAQISSVPAQNTITG